MPSSARAPAAPGGISASTEPSARTGSCYGHAHAATKHVRALCIPGNSERLQPGGLSQLEPPPPPHAGLVLDATPAERKGDEQRVGTMQQRTLSTSSALMDCTELGAVPAGPHRSHPLSGVNHHPLDSHRADHLHRARTGAAGPPRTSPRAAAELGLTPGATAPAKAAKTHNLHSNKTLRGCGELLFA